MIAQVPGPKGKSVVGTELLGPQHCTGYKPSWCLYPAGNRRKRNYYCYWLMSLLLMCL